MSSDQREMLASERVAEDLNGVFDGDGAALGGGETGEVHEAGHVAADEEVGVLFEHVVELERAHFSGDVGECYREGAAEAAALLGLAEGDERDVFDRGKQGAGGFARASAA